jgi:hypothetical protein
MSWALMDIVKTSLGLQLSPTNVDPGMIQDGKDFDLKARINGQKQAPLQEVG